MILIISKSGCIPKAGMIVLLLAALKKQDVELVGDRFDKWNIVSLVSVCIILCLLIVFCFQMCFKVDLKARREPGKSLIGSSILDD